MTEVIANRSPRGEMTKRWRPGILALGLGFGLLGPAGPGVAQTSPADTQALANRIEFLERQIRLLSERTTGVPGGTTVRPPAAAGAGSAVEDVGEAGSAATARLTVRVGQLEQDLRATTGRIEEVGFRLQQLEGKIDRLTTDLEYRLNQQGQSPAPGLGSPPPSSGGESGAPSGAPGGPRVLGALPTAEAPDRPETPPSFGTSPTAAPAPTQGQPPTPVERPASPPTTTAVPPVQPLSPREDYAQAFAHLQRASYGDAEKGFRQFLERYPNDALSSNARYWLGETYYAQGQYARAAETFLDGYEKNKTGQKAPDTLLKLGMALGQLGKSKEACASFRELGRAFPNAPAAVVEKAGQERQRLGCP